jgi:polysaccharide pyruvyl transferase WcaK-like protein
VRVGLWGTFDLENVGDMLYPRIVRRELERRVPRIELVPFSPIGYVGYNRFEDPSEEPAAPLGRWSPERLEELAGGIGVLAIGGGEILHDRDEELAPHYGLPLADLRALQTHRFFAEGLVDHGVPTAWLSIGVPFDPGPTLGERLRAAMARAASVTVRDEASRKRLMAAGVGGPIDVAPDLGFLASRLLPQDAIDRRLADLRARGAYPADRGALLIQGSVSLLPHAEAIATQVAELLEARDVAPLLVETGPIHGDGRFAERMAELLPGEPRRLPSDAGSDDLLAAIASSHGFVGSSLHGAVIAASFGRPWLMLNLAGQAKLPGVAATVDADDRVVDDPSAIAAAFARAVEDTGAADRIAQAARSLDEQLDRLAELATSTAVRACPPAVPRVTAPHPGTPDADRDRMALQVLLSDERDRRLAYEAEVAEVVGRTAQVEAWNLELDAGNRERDALLAERDRELAALGEEAGALRYRLEHLRVRDRLLPNRLGRALRAARERRRDRTTS